MSYISKKSKLDLIREILKDPDRKSLPRITYEFLVLFVKYREVPMHYFSRYLFKKYATNYKDYVPNKLCGKISVSINDHTIKAILDNKLFFDFFYRQFDINLPQILLYNHQNMFVYERRAIPVKNEEEFKVLLEDVFNNNPAIDSMIIKKTSSSSSGKGIFKLDKDQVNTDPGIIKTILAGVIGSDFIFQEKIKQHPALDKINPSCLNTIRIDTFINSEGEAEIASAYLRMSFDNYFIDNISSGGGEVGIELETGKLKKKGYALIQTLGVEILSEHPVTGTKFEGYDVPFFREVKELVVRVAPLLPGLRFIGWDVAVGANGPVLIEGNSDYDLSGNDLADEGYMANKTFRKVLKEINYL